MQYSMRGMLQPFPSNSVGGRPRARGCCSVVKRRRKRDRFHCHTYMTRPWTPPKKKALRLRFFKAQASSSLALGGPLCAQDCSVDWQATFAAAGADALFAHCQQWSPSGLSNTACNRRYQSYCYEIRSDQIRILGILSELCQHL